jgi:hypothetical protein
MVDRKLMLAILSVVAATHEPLLALNLLRDAGDAPPLSACDAEMEDDALLLSFVNRLSKLIAQFALAEPFFRAKVNYSVGPERYSFLRLERQQFGNSTSCKATFRFDMPGLKRVFTALNSPRSSSRAPASRPPARRSSSRRGRTAVPGAGERRL